MDRYLLDRAGRTTVGDEPPGTPDPVSLAASLERIRACVHRWLDRIEGELDGILAPPTAAVGVAAEELDRARRELEERGEAMRAEAERREREWREKLEALEHDRRLLGEAWDRLERERLSAAAPARPPADPPVAERAAPATRVAPAGDDRDDAVDRTILRQFEILRQDVRRKAEAQRIP